MKRSSGCSNWRITVHSVRPPRAPLGGGSSQPGITVHHHPGTWTHQNSTERAPTHSGKVSTRTSPSEELSGGRPGSPSGGYGEVWTYRCSSSGSPVFCAYTWGHPPWSSRWVWSAAARESPPSSSSSHLLLLSPPLLTPPLPFPCPLYDITFPPQNTWFATQWALLRHHLLKHLSTWPLLLAAHGCVCSAWKRFQAVVLPPWQGRPRTVTPPCSS